MAPKFTDNLRAFAVAVFTNKFTWLGLALYSLYWVAAALLPIGPLLESSGVLVLIGAAAILCTWFAAFAYGLASGVRIGAWQLPVGIWLTFLAITENQVWILIWRFSGQPDWMLDHHFLGQARWILFLSTILYLVSPGNDEGQVPIKNWYVVTLVVGTAMFLSGAVLTALILRQ